MADVKHRLFFMQLRHIFGAWGKDVGIAAAADQRHDLYLIAANGFDPVRDNGGGGGDVDGLVLFCVGLWTCHQSGHKG